MSDEQPQPQVTDTWIKDLPREMWDLVKDPALFVNAFHVIGNKSGDGGNVLRATLCENFGKAGPTIPRAAICMDISGALLLIEAMMKAVDSVDPGHAPPMEMFAALRAGTGRAPDMHDLAHKIADELMATSIQTSGRGVHVEDLVGIFERYLSVAYAAGMEAASGGGPVH